MFRKGSGKAPRSNRGGAGAPTKSMRRDGVMERSQGLRGASVVANRLRGGFMKPSWSLSGCSRRHHGPFVERSQSFGATLALPAIRQIMTGPGSLPSRSQHNLSLSAVVSPSLDIKQREACPNWRLTYDRAFLTDPRVEGTAMLSGTSRDIIWQKW